MAVTPSSELELLEPRPLLMAVAPTAEVVELFRRYDELCHRLLDPSDYQRIGDREFKKRSAWCKLRVPFNVSTQSWMETETRDDEGRIIRARYRARAIAPNGRYAESIGVCDVHERCCVPSCRKRHWHCPGAYQDRGPCPGYTHFSNAEHDIPSTAETRATNRASSNLFGLGEVSAEEVGTRTVDAMSEQGTPALEREPVGNGAPSPSPSTTTDGEIIEAKATPSSSAAGNLGEPGPTAGMVRSLGVAFKACGITTNAAKLDFEAEVLGRRPDRPLHITAVECDRLIDRLNTRRVEQIAAAEVAKAGPEEPGADDDTGDDGGQLTLGT